MEVDSKELIELLSKLNNLVEGFDEFYLNKKNSLTIKDKLLIFLYEKSLSPYELIKKLGLAKSNLALITSSLIKENLIIKKQDNVDKRNIIYFITEKGKERAVNILSLINNNINKQMHYKKHAEKINELTKSLNEILN